MRLTDLGSPQHRWYAFEPLPTATDDAVAVLLDALAAQPASARAHAAATLDADAVRTLLTFAERAASLAVRGDGGAIGRGLLAVALVWPACDDPSDAIPPLGLLHAAAVRAGADPAALFAAAGRLAPPDAAPVFPDFLTRPDLREIAAVMGYVEGTDAGGFRYYRTW